MTHGDVTVTNGGVRMTNGGVVTSPWGREDTPRNAKKVSFFLGMRQRGPRMTHGDVTMTKGGGPGGPS